MLVVDDRWENLSVVANLLEPIGFKVIEAHNGEEGLQKAREHQPDLIITDIAMPVMGGYKMMKHIRELPAPLNAVPIIVSSASVFATDEYKSFSAGADEFIPKPIKAESLFLAIKKQLGLDWLYEQDTPQVRGDRTSPLADHTPSNKSQTDPQNLILPPPEDLQKLYDLSRKGLVNDLMKQAESIQNSRPECAGFIQPLLKLAKVFQLKRLREFLEKHMLGNDT